MTRLRYLAKLLEAVRDLNKPVDRDPGHPDAPDTAPPWHPIHTDEKPLDKKKKRRKKRV